jgi:GNAT superfamily N-acetyltransferase
VSSNKSVRYSGVAIRPLRRGDHSAALAIAESLSEWFDADARRRAIPADLRHQQGFVALFGGRIVGFITLFFAEGRLNIGWMGVDLRHHNRGIGSRLMTCAERCGRRAGVSAIGIRLPAQIYDKPHELTPVFFSRRDFVPYHRITTDRSSRPQEVELRKLLAVWYSPEPNARPWRGRKASTTMRTAIQQLRKLKNTKFTPGTAATRKEIAEWERQTGLRLPRDHKQCLMTVGECRMHLYNPAQSHSYVVRLLPLKEVVPVAEVIGGHVVECCPGCRSWYAVADLQDGNYVLLDLATVQGDSVKVLDAFHETTPFDMAVIAESFTEFLAHAVEDHRLLGCGAGDLKKGTRFWSKPGGFYGEANPLWAPSQG